MNRKRRDFYIHWRWTGSTVWEGLKKFRCFDVEEAIEMAKEIWISDWNFNWHIIRSASDPIEPNGKQEILKYEFAAYEI